MVSGAADDSARQLREKEKKRVLAALVVHDLRSPLSAIQGYLGLLREELEEAGGAPVPQALAYIDDAATLVGKALGLVATILDVEELEDGILRAHRAPVRVMQLIDNARAGNRAQFEIRQVRLECEVAEDLVARVDPDLVGRVLENLIDNSVRYAPRGGRVSITVKRDDRGLELAIGNDGPPVPESEREQIFGRYFQVEARRASARANRGLGLYFCKLAAEAHGGSIHVEQRGELGAAFVVRLAE
ncbi:MAG TPA: HAMP domain-containing sensor histidine kinase [Kofleriaceae bacterium]|nr:HAMP domain-containing sensor histidine kinase [Kofleriaceae bacterium]